MPKFIMAAVVVTAGAILIVGGCSGPAKPPEPSEAEIHSHENGRLGWHSYRCTDGTKALVEFGDDGLQIRVGLVPGSSNVVRLTAPAAGLQFVGDQSTATLKGSRLILAGAAMGGTKSCERAQSF